MKLFRKILFWCHLTAGVLAGIVILIMSATGVLLTYEKQIIALADTRNYQITPPPGAARLPVETLLAKVREAQPGATLITFTLRADASAPAAIGLTSNPAARPGGGRTVFVNPYTGQVLGEGSQKVRNFFRAVTDWHRWLGAQGANRATARTITGACNLLFLFIVSSGFYLWWPRQLTRRQLRNMLWFRRGLVSKARDFNWHNVIGFWSCVPLFIIVLSGVVISYQWAGNLVYRIVGETPPAPGRGPGAAPQRNGTPAEAATLAGLDQAWARAEQQVPGWQSISLRLPNKADEPLNFTLDQGNGGQPHNRAQLVLDSKTGSVVRWEPFSNYSAGRRLRSILRFAHTGEVAGIFGQTLAGLVSLGGVFLVWTGLALALRRFRAWRAQRAKVMAEAVA